MVDYYYEDNKTLVMRNDNCEPIARIARVLDHDTIDILFKMYETGYAHGLDDGMVAQKIETRKIVFRLLGIEENDVTGGIIAQPEWDMKDTHRVLRIKSK